MEAVCAYCKKTFNAHAGHVNRARKNGLNFYCGRACSGLGRRKHLTDQQKKNRKAEYDRAYRANNDEKRRIQKQEWFLKDYALNPEKYKKKRQSKKEYQREFCRQLEYRIWKKDYDQKYRSKKKYSEFAEAALILNELEIHIDRYEASIQQGTFNKSKQRKNIQLCKVNLLQSI